MVDGVVPTTPKYMQFNQTFLVDYFPLKGFFSLHISLAPSYVVQF